MTARRRRCPSCGEEASVPDGWPEEEIDARLLDECPLIIYEPPAAGEGDTGGA